MDCAQFRENLQGLMEGDLPQEFASLVEQHLATCSGCRRELNQLGRTVRLVGSLVEVPPPPDLRARVARGAGEPAAAPIATCVRARDLLDDHAHGRLAPELADGMDAHLAGCRVCEREIATLEASIAFIRGLNEVDAPPWIHPRVQAEAARRSHPLRFRPVLKGAIGALAAAGAAAAVMLAIRAPVVVRQPAALAQRPARAGEQAAATALSKPAPTGVEETPVVTSSRAGATSAQAPAAARRARLAVKRTVIATRRGIDAMITAARPRLSAAPETSPPSVAVASTVLTAAATPVSHLAAADVEPPVDTQPQAHVEGSTESSQAAMVTLDRSPLSEVRQALLDQHRTEPLTLRPRHERDRFSSGPIRHWGF
ncbi:MAG TPA: anti-sigma factor [Armatimonadota bacterium]|nr:anti-sigma factor [Armatimonadota bacterium]